MLTEIEMRKAEEYEMQLFGFHSRGVCATLDRIVEEKIQMCCIKLSESLNRIYKPDNTSTLAFDVKSLIKAYRYHSHRHARVMKNCIRKLIAVPRNVSLEEDECQAITYSQGIECMEKHLKNLQSRARKATMLQAALKDELELIEEIGPQSNLVEMVSTVVESNLTQPKVVTEMTKCVSSYHLFEDIFKESKYEAANVYANDLHNVPIIELDLHASQPNVQ